MLHTAIIPHSTSELLNILIKKEYLQKFILFGGTALAMQLEHRPAQDLHLFTNTDFDVKFLKNKISEDFSDFHIENERDNALVTKINNIKVDFVKYKYNFDFPVVEKDGIRFANLKDIAPMKIDAIASRGKKKDFYDLYFLLKQFSLPELLEFYQKKYNHSSIFHVVKSVSYFDDAENNPDPIIFDKKLTWKKVKKTISDEISKL